MRASTSLARTDSAAALYAARALRGCPGAAPTSVSRAREISRSSEPASVGSGGGGGTRGAPAPALRAVDFAAGALSGVITATTAGLSARPPRRGAEEEERAQEALLLLLAAPRGWRSERGMARER